MRLLVLSVIIGIASFGIARWIFGSPSPARTSAPQEPKRLPAGISERPAASPTAVDGKPKRSRAELIHDAMEDKDVFRAAASAIEWLEAASVQELRDLAMDSKKSGRAHFAGFEGDYHSAFLQAVVDRWLTLAPGDLETIEKANIHPLAIEHLHAAAARAKPELVIARFAADGQKTPFERVTSIAFETLGERVPAAARRFLESVSDPIVRRGYEFCIIMGLAKKDALSAATQLPRAQPQGNQPDSAYLSAMTAIVREAEQAGVGVLRQVIASANGAFDSYHEMPRLLLRFPDLAEDLALRGASLPAGLYTLDEKLLREADQTSAENRAKLLGNYDKLPVAGRDHLSAALTCSWARTEPRAAADWAVAHAKTDDADSSANFAAQYVLERWAHTDPRAAFEWWKSLPPSAMRDAVGQEVSTRYAEEGDFDTALQLYRPVGGKPHEQATNHFAQLYAKHDPAAAAEWLGSLPAGIGTDHAVNSVSHQLFLVDPQAAFRWAESLPEGSVRDQAASQIVSKVMPSDPSIAAKWVEKIGDAKRRNSSAQLVAYSWNRRDPVAAREWVRALPGLEEKWTSKFLKQ